MEQSVRKVVPLPGLGGMAFTFAGAVQPFPSHFHEEYTLGLVERGTRTLVWQRGQVRLTPGDLLILPPGESHGCACQTADFAYRGLHLPPETAEGLGAHPRRGVASGPAAGYFFRAHQALMAGDIRRGAEGLREVFALIGSRFSQEAALIPESPAGPVSPAQARLWSQTADWACRYLQGQEARPVTLDQLCRQAGVSRSTLLRAFAWETGVTPLRYWQAVRIVRAQAFLRQGMPPARAALETGFCDQSHFSRWFRAFLGVPPAVYQRTACTKEVMNDGKMRDRFG